jgi:cation:H+ antiporter
MIEILSSQSLWVTVVAGFAALAMLILSSNLAVKKVIGLAGYLGVSGAFMGMTVLSLATSIPEISSHLTASVGILTGRLDYKIGSAIVIGANIGSDVVQQTLIMGIVVLLAGQLYFRRYLLWKSLLPLVVTTLVCLVLGLDGQFSRLDGLILFGLFVGYTYFLYWDERRYYKKPANIAEEEEVPAPTTAGEAALSVLVALGAMGVTILAAQVVLVVTEMVVERTGVGGSFIGVVTLGVASALPELVTALAGVRHNEHGVSLGTLIGSNITNPLVGIGLGALVSTYWVPGPSLYWDFPWQSLTGALLWVLLWFTKGKLNRYGAAYLIVLYVLYVGLRAVFFLAD